MNKKEIESLFKKYKVRIPKEKQGQSECHECKRNHKYSLTWTSFLYEYKENYYCFEHIVNILLQQENQQLKADYGTKVQVERDMLQQENKILKENAENNDKVVDKVNWENQLLKKENKQLKDNWNKLKEWVEEGKKISSVQDNRIGYNFTTFILDKIQEIEGGMNI